MLQSYFDAMVAAWQVLLEVFGELGLWRSFPGLVPAANACCAYPSKLGLLDLPKRTTLRCRILPIQQMPPCELILCCTLMKLY